MQNEITLNFTVKLIVYAYKAKDIYGCNVFGTIFWIWFCTRQGETEYIDYQDR